MKSSNKTVKILIVAMAVLTLINFFAIAQVNAILNSPQTNVQTEVLGAAFKDRALPNTIDIDLIRPPRKVVNPGDTHFQEMTLTNTANFPIYFRCSYLIKIEDADGNIIEDFDSNVIVNMDSNWEYNDGYWYYHGVVDANGKIDGPITSIKYSINFDNHRDYKVYVPLVIESVEAREFPIDEIDYWPNEDIYDVDYKQVDKAAAWTTKAQIIIR